MHDGQDHFTFNLRFLIRFFSKNFHSFISRLVRERLTVPHIQKIHYDEFH